MNRPLIPRLAVCCLLTLQLALLPRLSQQIDQLDDQKQQRQNFHEESTPRSLQSNSNSNYNYNYQTCPNNDDNENENINQVLSYLDDHKPSIENQILQSYTSARGNATKPSLQYLYADFRSALEWMATVGVDKQSTKNTNNNNDNNNDNAFKFYMGPNNCNKDGWHIGLANIATFLSQSMTTVILNDTCDELNWEMVQPPNGVDVSGKSGVYPISNACGQLGYQYDDSPFHTCSGDAQDAKFACPIDPTMEITATSKSSLRRTPPELQCFPRTDDMPYTGFYNPNGNSNVVINGLGVVPNRAGRTDVEG